MASVPSPNALGYAYRIADTAAWKAWLSRIAGSPTADLEVVHRTLRVRDQGAAARVAEAAQESSSVRRCLRQRSRRRPRQSPASAPACDRHRKSAAGPAPVDARRV